MHAPIPVRPWITQIEMDCQGYATVAGMRNGPYSGGREVGVQSEWSKP
ncbi:MAG: hypothetical protein NXI32_19470 [bacterium]|nr:hypothetical protein [bacterium]